MSSLNTQITFIRDSTIRVKAVIKDFDGVLVDPASDVVIFYDPSGTNMGTKTTTKAGTSSPCGTYTVDYNIPVGGTIGDWYCSWKVTTSGSYIAREIIYFHVGAK